MDDKPIREINPVVVPAQYFVLGTLTAGLISLLPGAAVALIVLEISDIPDVQDPYMPSAHQWGLVFGYAVAAYALAFVVSMVFIGMKVFEEPGRTSYTIFPDRIEFCEGLWIRNRRTLALDPVIDVKLEEGVLQQTRGAGTVTLVTQQGRTTLTNVPQPKEVYDLIRSLALKKARA